MADTVNAQVTDSVTQANVKVLGEAPAFAMAALFQVAGNASAMAINNATSTSGELGKVGLAVATAGSEMIMKLATKS